MSNDITPSTLPKAPTFLANADAMLAARKETK